MAVVEIQEGQRWCLDETGENWLVTKVYSEAFTPYAMLRKASGSDDVRRVEVVNSSRGAALPGFTFTQGSQKF